MNLYAIILKKDNRFICFCDADTAAQAITKAAEHYKCREWAFVAVECKEGVTCLS